jgi:trehalose 6-phosphate phosphatase
MGNCDKPEDAQTIPSAWDQVEELAQKIKGKRLTVFLDYDGTLTPIVDQPELAVLAEEMREIIQRLSEVCPVAVVSGRDRVDVQALVNVDTVTYAGSHGFDILSPGELAFQHQEGRRCRPALQKAGDELHQRLKDIAGVRVERKAFAVAVHFRQVEESWVPEMKRRVEALATHYPELRLTGGKKIFELRPRLDWDKGKAVWWLLNALHLDAKTFPIYIGDDETDEDAFRALKDRGLGILVTQEFPPTAAHYRLNDSDDVKAFLKALLGIIQRKPT